jgi:ribosomal protein S18 acetylase RimI-like enzyme
MTALAPTTAELDHPATAPLLLAFADDPILRWFLPEGAAFLEVFPQLVGSALRAAGGAGPGGVADCTDEADAAAVWVRPGAAMDEEAMGEALFAALPAARHAEVLGFLEQMAAHHPADPLWYLPFIGVDPTRQGRGLGSTLLRTGLARCEEDRVPAYLEASSPRNRALYERHGFEVVAEVRVPGSPPLWPMLRPNRPDRCAEGGAR